MQLYILLGKFHGRETCRPNPWHLKELDMTEQLNTRYKLALLTVWTVQWVWEKRFWSKEQTLIWEPPDWEDGRLAPQNNHLVLWLPGSFMDQRWWGGGVRGVGRWRSKVKRLFSLCKCALRWQASGRGICWFHLFTVLRKAIMYIYKTKKGWSHRSRSSVNLKLTLPSYTHIYFKKCRLRN